MKEPEEIKRFNQDLEAFLEGGSSSQEGDSQLLRTSRRLASTNFSIGSRNRETTRARLLAQHSLLKKPSRFTWKTRFLSLRTPLAFSAAMVLLALFLAWALTNTTPKPANNPLVPPTTDMNVVISGPTETSDDILHSISGLLLYESRSSGNGEIYLSRADGSDRRNLTNHPAEDRNPVWSPDEGQIAFISERTGTGQVYLMNVDGSGLKQLTSYDQITEVTRCSQSMPSTGVKFLGFVQLDWSPDGEYLVAPLAMEIDGSMVEFLYLIHTDGSGLLQFTSTGNDINPQWSPDGQHIAFSRLISCEGDVTHDIFRIDRDSTNLTNLTHSPASEITFSWSPDGSQIAYFSTGIQDETGLHDEVKLMESDGSNSRTLVNLGPGHEFDNGDFAWLPGGDRLAFIPPNESGDIEIRTVSTDGTGLGSLVSNQDNFRSLDLSPDGKWLLASASVENPIFYFIPTESPAQYFRMPDGGLNPHWARNTTEAAVRAVVEGFGKVLQMVSLQAPDAQETMQKFYSPFVSSQLLEVWMQDPYNAPGRIVSSPWPDRIEITAISKESPTKYSVTGEIIEVTSMEVVNGGAADRIPVQITLEEDQGTWMITGYQQESYYNSNLSSTPTPPSTQPDLNFDPYPYSLSFEWVPGQNPSFYYANIYANGNYLGKVDFGSIQGGWCDRSSNGGVIAFVHENVIKAGVVGFGDEPPTLRWFKLNEVNQVYEPLPDLVILSPGAFSPNDFRVAFGACTSDGECGLFTYDLTDGQLKRISSDMPYTYSLWSPDGKQFAFWLPSDQTSGDLPLIRVIEVGNSNIVYTGRPNDPESPLKDWGLTMPEGITGTENCETPPNLQSPDPLTLDSTSEEIRQRILYSYQNWQTLWVEAQVDESNGSITSNQRVQVWVDQPAQARLLSGPVEGAPAFLWISDGEKTRTGEEVRIDPNYVPPLGESNTVYPHPMTGIMPNPLSQLLFPSGLAQRGGEYRPIRVESLAGREALVVEWRRPDGTLTDRFWVDTTTGVILRDQNYGKESDGGLTSDLTLTAIEYDLEFPSDTFDRLAPFPPAFAEGSEDIFMETGTPTPPGEVDSSLAYGEIYMFLETPSGFENAGLVHFPASCLLTGKTCPKPALVQDLPGGFLYPDFSLSPDRNQIFFSANNLEPYVWIFDVPSGNWTQLEVPFFSGAGWSPDGNWLVGQPVIYGDAQSSPLMLARADGSEWRQIMTELPGFKYARGWLDNHRILLVNTLDNQTSEEDPFVYSEIQIYDLRTGEVSVITGVRTDTNTSIFGTPALSPDRTKVLYTVQDQTSGTTQITIQDLVDSRDESSFRYDHPVGAEWSPDGDWLSLEAALGYTCEIHLVRTDGTGDRLLFTGDWGGACNYVWSPDGRYLLIPGLVQEPTVPRLYVVNVVTGEPRLITLPDMGVTFEGLQAVWLP